MIDLDVLEELGEANAKKRDHSLYLAFAAKLCRGSIDYDTFQRITRWLGCYHYVLPFERAVIPELTDFLYCRNRTRLLHLALLVSHIEANLTQTMQAMLLEKLQRDSEETPCAMAELPGNRAILTSDAPLYLYDYPSTESS